MLKNSEERYGWIAIILHWGIAFTVIGLFWLGLYMRGLDYYDSWYQTAPEIHKAIGILLFLVLIVRIVLRFFNPPPRPEPGRHWEQVAAKLMHWVLYALIFLVCLSGYFITTADERAIDVFGWFSVPAIVTSLENQEDVAGEIHEILAYLIIALAVFHALAALKHHFFDKDATLLKMLGFGGR